MRWIQTKNHGDQRHPRDTTNTAATILHFSVAALLRKGKKVMLELEEDKKRVCVIEVKGMWHQSEVLRSS
jgi:hypothetical protein